MHIVFAFLYIAVLVLVYFLTEDWFSPARIHTLIWTCLYLGYIIFADNRILGYKGVTWLLVSCLFMTVGEIIGKKLFRGSMSNTQMQTEAEKQAAIESRAIKPLPEYLWYLILLTFVFGLIGNYMEIRMYGYDLSVFFDLSKLLEMNNVIAVDRYSGEGKSSAWVTLFTAFRYGGSICGGYAFIYAKKWTNRICCFLPLLAGLINMMINNTKIGMISSVFLFAIGFATAYMSYHGRAPKIKSKTFLIVCGSVAVLFAVLMVSMIFRTGSFNESAFIQIKEKFVVYAFGCVESFDYWLSNVYEFGAYDLGVNTFMAPFALVGLVEKQQGIYSLYPGIQSNVFTGYRGVITDWGVFGGLAVIMLAGIVSGFAIMRIRRGEGMIFSKLVFASIGFFILHAFAVSPWVYTTYWAAMVMFFGFLLLSGRSPFRVK